MNLVNKPKTQRGARYLENAGPKLVENTKQTLFIKGATANGNMTQLLKDLHAIKNPYSVYFGKKMNKNNTGKSNQYNPFEDIEPLEFLSKKNDASLQVFASHNKKRPNNLIFSRYYDNRLLDMIELGVDNFKSLSDFKNAKIQIGCKPTLAFVGDFDSTQELQKFKNIMIDFFTGPIVDSIALKGLEHFLTFTSVEGKIYFKSYKNSMENCGLGAPKTSLVEIGPSMDFTLRRNKFASDDLYKRACRRPTGLKAKKKKNVENKLGTQYGKVHMTRQNYDNLTTRKFLKGKKSIDTAESEEAVKSDDQEMDTE